MSNEYGTYSFASGRVSNDYLPYSLPVFAGISLPVFANLRPWSPLETIYYRSFSKTSFKTTFSNEKNTFEIYYCRFETHFENENPKRKRQRPDLENSRPVVCVYVLINGIES